MLLWIFLDFWDGRGSDRTNFARAGLRYQPAAEYYELGIFLASFERSVWFEFRWLFGRQVKILFYFV